MEIKSTSGDFVCIRALGGTQIIGLTRGDETKSHHTENLDKGEVLLVQFTDKTSAIKVRGNAEIYTPYGVVHAVKE